MKRNWMFNVLIIVVAMMGITFWGHHVQPISAQKLIEHSLFTPIEIIINDKSVTDMNIPKENQQNFMDTLLKQVSLHELKESQRVPEEIGSEHRITNTSHNGESMVIYENEWLFFDDNIYVINGKNLIDWELFYNTVVEYENFKGMID